MLVGFSLILAVCCCTKSKSTNPDTKVPDFAIEVSPRSKSVTPGDSAEFKVKLTSVNGFSGVCTLSAAGYPEGDSAAFDSKTLVPTDSSRLMIHTATSTPQQTYEVVITGKDGKVSHSDSVTLAVPSQKVTDYYPLAVGNAWKYVLLDHTGRTLMSFAYKIEDTMTVGGNFGYVFSDGGFLYARGDTIFDGFGEIILAGPLVMGQSWIARSWKYELIEFGAVTLTDGTEYENCIKLKKTDPVYPGAKEYEWWAKDVGMVKYETYASGLYQGSRELVSFIHD